MNLSANFTLEEMLRSQTAQDHNIAEQYTPQPVIVNALAALCTNVLQPLRDYCAKTYPGSYIQVTSGYRCPRVNALQGGASSTSQHMQGEAADIKLILNGAIRNDLLVTCCKVVFKTKPFDQLILEHGASPLNPQWVHISYNFGNSQRRSVLRKSDAPGYSPYKLF